MKFKNCLIVIFIVLLFSGCTLLGEVVKIPPKEARKGFDKLCQNAFSDIEGQPAKKENSVLGYYEGGYYGRHLENYLARLTGQQLKDVEYAEKFCAKIPAERTAYEYGYMTGVVRRTLRDLLPVGLIKDIPELVPLLSLL